jgi:hypothetical protein
MAITKTPPPDAAVLGEFAIVAAENARRLLTGAESLLTRGGWPTAHSRCWHWRRQASPVAVSRSSVQQRHPLSICSPDPLTPADTTFRASLLSAPGSGSR